MLATLENARRYTLRRLRAFPWPSTRQRPPNLRLPFIQIELPSARRNPVAPPEEINRGMATGNQGVKPLGIGPPDNGVAKAVLMNVFFFAHLRWLWIGVRAALFCLMGKFLMMAQDWCSRRPFPFWLRGKLGK